MERGTGATYYGRPQLKPAPFNNWLVGSYVFLAGLSGAAQLLATVLDLGARPTGREQPCAADACCLCWRRHWVRFA